MNYFGVFVLSVLAVSAPAYGTPQQFRAGLKKLIDTWKNGNVRSLPIRLPSITPLTLPPMTSQDEDGLFTMSIGEAKVYGIQRMSVQQLQTSPGWISIDLSIPILMIRADYHLTMEPIRLIFGKIQLLNDQGSFMLDVKDVRVHANVQFGASGADTVINYLDVNFSASDLQVYLSGSTPSTIERVQRKFWSRLNSRKYKNWIENKIKNMAQAYLQGHTPQQLMNMVSSI